VREVREVEGRGRVRLAGACVEAARLRDDQRGEAEGVREEQREQRALHRPASGVEEPAW